MEEDRNNFFEQEKEFQRFAMGEWITRISSNPDTLILPDPNYTEPVTCFDDARDASRGIGGNRERIIRPETAISDENETYSQYIYFQQRGKNRADMETELVREKRKETTRVTHAMTDYGFVRGKKFCDGTQLLNVIANGRIEEIHRWKIGGKEFVRLLVSDIATGYIKKERVCTEIFEVSRLEEDKFVELLLARYFKPSDSRVYRPSALKDFRARLYEMIYAAQIIRVCETTGWHKNGKKMFFFDGSKYPQNSHPLAQLRRIGSKTSLSLDEILTSICEELNDVDFGNRISFLLGYGLTTWFADVCVQEWNGCPGIILLGRKNVCVKYAEACLKIYRRATGEDIINLSEVDKKELLQYIDVIRGDAIVIDCYDFSKSALKLAKTIVSGKSVSNHKVNVPIVILQNIPSDGLFYEDYVILDLNGVKVSESFVLMMQELKAALITSFEAASYEDGIKRGPVPYETVAEQVFDVVKRHLVSDGASKHIVDRFISRLKKGMEASQCFCGNEKEGLRYMFMQRIEQLIDTKQLCVTGEVTSGISDDQKNSIVVRTGKVYIPSSFLEKILLPTIGLEISDFKRIRDVLIGQQLLFTYDAAKTFTKKITISNGERIYAYETAMELFPIIEKMLAKCKEDKL